MKFKTLLILFSIIGLKAFSQTPNTLSVVYGAGTTLVNIHGAIGDYGYNAKTGMLGDLLYTRQFNKIFSLQTGVLFADDKVELNSIEAGLRNRDFYGDVKAISIPVTAKVTFFKYLFFDAGLSADLQTNYVNANVINNQSGLGGEIGFGGQVPLGKVLIFVNPYMHQYNITAFDNNLNEFGVKFGLGYRF